MDDLVIFIHGTFAGDKEQRDTGERWWQRGSITWEWFESNLPHAVKLPDEQVRLFHWSGENSQTERLSASTRLLALLIDLERQGRGYHLVGHSHGGSVIWESLISSEVIRTTKQVDEVLLRELKDRGIVRVRGSRRKQVPGILAYPQIRTEVSLSGLRSWTTVGTPFLHYLPQRRWLVNGWPDPAFSLAPRVTIGGAEVMDAAALLATTLGVFLSGMGLAGAVGRSPIAPWVLGFVACFALLFFAFWSHARRALSSALIFREHAGHRVVCRFAKRWLGLWAPTDEAIGAMAGLTSSVSFDYPWLCSPQAKRDRRPAPDALTDMFTVPLRLTPPANSVNLVPEAPLFWPFRKLLALTSYAFNRWLAPRIRKFITEVIIRSSQGCDIPGAVLAYASPWPLPLPDPVAGLPEKSAARLEESANQHAAKAGPDVRGLLATALLDGVPLPKLLKEGGNPFHEISLVHTSYFGDPDVLTLIALHIIKAHGTAEAENDIGSDRELGIWLDKTGETVSARFDDFLKDVRREPGDLRMPVGFRLEGRRLATRVQLVAS